MSSHPQIIGLTLNYRDAERTYRCINSLLKEGATHVLAWDNSEDEGNSAAALSTSLSNNPNVSIEVSPNNLGFAAGVNRGIEWIKGHFDSAWVLLLNNDAHLLPGAIDSLARRLSENAQAIISYPDIDHAGQVLGTIYYQRHTGLLTTKPMPGSFPYASGCCQLVAIERIETPIFDEDFFMYGEDWAQGWSLGTKKMVHVPTTLVTHEGTKSSGIGTKFYENSIIAGHILLTKKLSKSPYPVSTPLLGHWTTLTLRALLRSMRYRSLIPLYALHEGHKLYRKSINKYNYPSN